MNVWTTIRGKTANTRHLGAALSLLFALFLAMGQAQSLHAADADQSGSGAASIPLPLSLDDCVREALNANHALLARSFDSAAANARRSAATAARLPRLGVQAGALYSSDPLRVRGATFNGEPGVFSREIWQASVGASLPLATGGRLVAEQEAARLLAEATQADFSHARQLLAVRIVSLFEESLALREVVASLDQSRITLTAQLERIEALLRQQKAADVDRLRVSVRLARVEQTAIEARSRLEVVQATLAVLMGRDPGVLIELRGELISPANSTVASQPMSERGDEIAARARADAANQQVRAARAGWWPNLDAVASWGPRSDFDGRGRYEAGLAGVQVSWNFWDFGRTKARLSESKATARVREELSLETSLQRKLEYTASDSAVRSAEARIAASRLAVEQAQESLRIEQRKYDLGQGAIVDVLDAQAAAVEAASLRARALADYAIAVASRDFANGRIFTAEASLPALRADPSITSNSVRR